MKAFDNKVDGAAVVFTDDHGIHQVMTPKGEILSHVVSTVTIDPCDDAATCQVTLRVSLAKGEEQARETIASYVQK